MVKVKVKVPPLGWMQPVPPAGPQLVGLESNTGGLASEVTLWGDASMFVQVTEVFVVTFSGVGL